MWLKETILNGPIGNTTVLCSCGSASTVQEKAALRSWLRDPAETPEDGPGGGDQGPLEDKGVPGRVPLN